MCIDGAHASRVPSLRPATLLGEREREHGAPGVRADPAELERGETQPSGTWHCPVCQVRAAGLRGAREGVPHRSGLEIAGFVTGGGEIVRLRWCS